MKTKKILLAFSGGLDTCFCLKYLQEKGYKVHTATVDTGSFSNEELKSIENTAMELGSENHVNLECTDQFYQKIIKFLIFGNVLKNGNYPLSVSSERVYQTIALANYAKTNGFEAIAHGSTGAGNDQVRFDMIFHLVNPEIEIITPVRDLNITREAEVAFLIEHGVPGNWSKAKYSINKGLWGTSVGGGETLSSDQGLPDSAWTNGLSTSKKERLTLSFNKGELCGLNGKAMAPVEVIKELSQIANQFAIGRDMHVGDTIIGIKGRVGFEAAGPLIIIKSHQLLEKHTLSKWQLHWKEQLSNWYGMFLHEAQYFEPVMRNIEGFMESSQQNVTGDVYVDLYPFRFVVVGIKSPKDLMNPHFGTYGENNKGWTSDDVKGFTKIVSNSTKLFQFVNN